MLNNKGTRKERNQLKVSPKMGPLANQVKKLCAWVWENWAASESCRTQTSDDTVPLP